ncbi:hypothetical protein NEOLI_003562 [Neolecta irregularis DAH-3]|uniref:Uncharacterized protein n=1 Tax=Neolecta irregularis (strain DAH-3) TaxID=1198029 RepID=A0A1U7LNR3_NEOID|nr:hypothetical protein NEOLI_003562 [Neolecta irregularis DAH-3]|eukprot:OLL24182.1 hypothetical protein NEOLI_003562 [Neolecta irregularis DAH-3]
MVDKSFTQHKQEPLPHLLQTYLGAEYSQIPSADLLIHLKADLRALQQRAQKRAKDYAKDTIILAGRWKAEETRRMSIKRPVFKEKGASHTSIPLTEAPSEESDDIPLAKKQKLGSEQLPIDDYNGNTTLLELF